MKKYLIVLFILLLIFPGCSKKDNDNGKTIAEKPVQEQSGTKEPEKEPEKSQEEESPEKAEGSGFADFPEVFEGKFSDLAIKFGDSKDKVLEELGDPDETTSWQGADLYVYDNLGIYIDPTEEKVTGLTAGIGYITYGVQIGYTVDQIKEILGKPDYEGISLESGASVMEYEAGDFLVEFTIQPESKQSVGITLYGYSY